MAKRKFTKRRKGIVLCMVLLLVIFAGIVYGTNKSRSLHKEESINIGITVYDKSDTFIASIMNSLDVIVKEQDVSEGIKVKFNIVYAERDQITQNSQVEKFIALGYDVICVNMVDRTSVSDIIDRTQEAGIPLIFFNREPVEDDMYRSDNIYYVGSDAKETAILQGEIIANAYLNDNSYIDRNQNGTIECLLLSAVMVGGMLAGCGNDVNDTKATEANKAETAATEADGSSDTDSADTTKENLTFGVLIYKYDDTYISTVRNAIEKYAGESSVTITLNMQDGQGDQAKQNDQLDILIEKKVDVLIINAVDAGSAQGLADKAKEAGIPAIFFNREPDASVMESIDSIFIGTTASEAGVMQGDLLADFWEENPAYDLNDDGKVQYLVFKGEPGNPEAEARTEYAVKQAEERGLTMENVNGEPIVANWATDQAQSSMEAILAAHEGEIEAVFCNNDDMALGVIAALNNEGYNTEAGSEKWIPVIGVDATDAGIEAINQGKMAATVKQDGDAMGKAVVEIAINVAQGKDFVEGTEYEIAADGVSVRIPYAPIK